MQKFACNFSTFIFSGILNYLTTDKNTTWVLVEKISNLKTTKEAKVKVDEKDEKYYNMISKIIKRTFCYEYNYGIPFLFEKNDTISIPLPHKQVVANLSFVDSENTEDEDLFAASILGSELESFNLQNITNNLSQLNVSESGIETSFLQLGEEERDTLAKKEFSGFEKDDTRILMENICVPLENQTHSFKTSTPKSNVNYSKKSCRAKKKGRRKDGTNVSSFPTLYKPEQQPIFYQISHDCSFEFITQEAEKMESDARSWHFYRDEPFYRFKEIVQKKLQSYSQGKFIHNCIKIC